MSWVATGIAVAGGIGKIAGGFAGQDAAKEAGKDQAAAILRTEEENQRRRQLDLDQKMGLITASVGASNILMSGSSKKYARGYSNAYRQEMAWDNMLANMNAKAAIKGGRMAGEAAMWSGITGAVGSFGAAAGSVMSHGAANNGNPFYLGSQPGKG